jgi:putative Mg2+ transporter-C (MgtC) family protein
VSTFLQTNAYAFADTLWQTLIPLLVAAFCGGIIGIERESANRPAGLRTHVLVCVGATLVMNVSIGMYVMTNSGLNGNGDPGRIAAQVVSGIGFLGAGTIMREGSTIRGLTTAASLWVVSAIGLAVGAGMFLEGIVAVVIVVLTLKTLSVVERRWISKGGHHNLIIHVADMPGRLGALATVVGRWGANIKTVSMRPGPVSGTVEIAFYLKMTGRAKDTTGLVGDLMATEGVVSVTEEE